MIYSVRDGNDQHLGMGTVPSSRKLDPTIHMKTNQRLNLRYVVFNECGTGSYQGLPGGGR